MATITASFVGRETNVWLIVSLIIVNSASHRLY